MLKGTSGHLARSMTATPAQDRRTSSPLNPSFWLVLLGPTGPRSGMVFIEFSSIFTSRMAAIVRFRLSCFVEDDKRPS